MKYLLTLWLENGLPREFIYDGVKPAMNKGSGYVFLVNSDYQIAMINDETNNLEVWYNLPYSGHEGFLMDLFLENDPELICDEDREYLISSRTDEAFEYEKLSADWKEWIDSTIENEK